MRLVIFFSVFITFLVDGCHNLGYYRLVNTTGNDMQPIYLIEHQGLRARYFLEIDRDSNSRSEVIDMIRTKQCDPVKILEVDEDAGSCRDVTDELVAEALDPVMA